MEYNSKIIENYNKILNLYIKYGSSDYIGENLTQIEHGIQCADVATNDTRLQQYDSYIRNCVIVASLLHDIGHLVGIECNEMEMKEDNGLNLGIVGHEGIGSNYLRECGMPELVCELVQSHVLAKRYLCTMQKSYYDNLSDASKATMKIQGGLMTPTEIKSFENSYRWELELKLFIREYDDKGKNSTISEKYNSIEKYKKEIIQALEDDEQLTFNNP